MIVTDLNSVQICHKVTLEAIWKRIHASDSILLYGKSSELPPEDVLRSKSEFHPILCLYSAIKLGVPKYDTSMNCAV